MPSNALKSVLSIVLLVSALLPSFARAFTGNDVLNYCPTALNIENATSPEALMKSMHCIGYVGGLNDATRMLQDFYAKHSYCIPETGLQNDQVVRVFLKWLAEHPETLHESARGLFLTAMGAAFPCGKQ